MLHLNPCVSISYMLSVVMGERTQIEKGRNKKAYFWVIEGFRGLVCHQGLGFFHLPASSHLVNSSSLRTDA